MEFKRSNMGWLVLSLIIGVISQIMMVRSTNLGGELVLQNKATTIQNQVQEVTKIIKNTKSELFRIASLKSDSAGRFGRFTKLQLYLEPLQVFIYHDKKPIFWTTSDLFIKPGSADSVTVETIGGNSVGIWRYKQGSVEILYVLSLAKESQLPLIGSSESVSTYRENEFKISPNPVQNSVPVVTNALPLFHLVTNHQKPFWVWDVLFLIAVWRFVRSLNRCIQSRWSFVGVKLFILIGYLALLFAGYQGYTLNSITALDIFSDQVFTEVSGRYSS